MVFEYIIWYSPRRRASPCLAEGFSPTARGAYRIYFSISRMPALPGAHSHPGRMPALPGAHSHPGRMPALPGAHSHPGRMPALPGAHSHPGRMPALPGAHSHPGRMVFEELFRHSPRRRASPCLAEGFSPTARGAYRIYFSISRMPALPGAHSHPGRMPALPGAHSHPGRMVFEELFRHSPRRRASPCLAEGFSPTARGAYRIYFSISMMPALPGAHSHVHHPSAY
jgi:hypothetical protein